MTKDQSGQRNNVVPFPFSPELARARRAYHRELARVDRLEYEGKQFRLNKRIKDAYFAAYFEVHGRFR